MQSVKIDSGV